MNYVFITVSELTGDESQVQLGQVKEDITIDELLLRSLDRIARYLPEKDRKNSRHFWYNDQFVPKDGKYLRDLSPNTNVTLALRPDYYLVKLLNAKEEKYAIDPELTTAQAIDSILERQGAWRCFDMISDGGTPLVPTVHLWKQDILPYNYNLSQKEHILHIRRKNMAWALSAILITITILLGLITGYVAAKLGV